MNLLPGVSLLRIGIYAAIVAGLVGFGAYVEHGRMQKKLDKVTAEYNQFKGGVAALGEAARIAAEKKARADFRRKEVADEENKRARERDLADAGRVRRDIARRGILPPAATAPGGAPRAGVNWSDVESALRDFVGEVAGQVAEGADAVTGLDTGKRWAKP